MSIHSTTRGSANSASTSCASDISNGLATKRPGDHVQIAGEVRIGGDHRAAPGRRRSAIRRDRVSPSATPSHGLGRQWRWKAVTTRARSSSNGPVAEGHSPVRTSAPRRARTANPSSPIASATPGAGGGSTQSPCPAAARSRHEQLAGILLAPRRDIQVGRGLAIIDGPAAANVSDQVGQGCDLRRRERLVADLVPGIGDFDHDRRAGH